MEVGNISITSERSGVGFAQENRKVIIPLENDKLKSIIKAVLNSPDKESLAGKSIQVSSTLICWFKRKEVQFSTNESFVTLKYSLFKDLCALIKSSGLTIGIRNKYERQLVSNLLELLSAIPSEKQKHLLASLKSKEEYALKKVGSIMVRASKLSTRNEYVMFVARRLLLEKHELLDLIIYSKTVCENM